MARSLDVRDQLAPMFRLEAKCFVGPHGSVHLIGEIGRWAVSSTDNAVVLVNRAQPDQPPSLLADLAALRSVIKVPMVLSKEPHDQFLRLEAVHLATKLLIQYARSTAKLLEKNSAKSSRPLSPPPPCSKPAKKRTLEPAGSTLPPTKTLKKNGE